MFTVIKIPNISFSTRFASVLKKINKKPNKNREFQIKNTFCIILKKY